MDVALRPEMGKLLNQAKNEVKDLIDEKRMELKLKASEVSPDFDLFCSGYPADRRRTSPDHADVL